MKIVILGAGIRGFQIAKHLIEEKKDVVIIESDPQKASNASLKLDCLVVNGSGTSIEVLQEAGIDNSDFFISMTDSDEVNMVACGLVSSEFDVKLKIACIRNLTYIGSHGLSGKFLGIDYIINPEAEVAKAIFEIINKGVFSEMISFQKTELILSNINITKQSEFLSKNLNELRKTLKKDFLIAAIHRSSKLIVPSGNTIIREGDTLSVVSEDASIIDSMKSLGTLKEKVKKIVLVGGSKTARFLLKNFEPQDRKKIALIDKDSKICKSFADQFPEILTINADVTDETLFEDEDLHTYDLMITLTENDELNILTAIYAKKFGIKKSLALTNNNNYLRLAPYLDLDNVITVSGATVNSALRYIRGENFKSVHSLFEGKLEVFEFQITKESSVLNKKIKDINLRNKGLIAGITRNEENIIPSGNTALLENDVIIVTVERSYVDYVQELFN